MNRVDGVVALIPTAFVERMASIVRRSSGTPFVPASKLSELRKATSAMNSRSWLLVSFGTSILVPPDILASFESGAVNFHAAPPEYPGRDPHHFAIYDGVTKYGATAHMMVERVDAGTVIDARFFDVTERDTPADLLNRANELSWTLVEELLPRLIERDMPKPLDMHWGSRKTTRSDFLDLCRIPGSADPEEVRRRVRATMFGDRCNAFIELHGHRFRLEASGGTGTSVPAQWEEFTMTAYARLLSVAAQKYRFARYGESIDERHVLWRHDVDFSVHRALGMARLEYEKGLRATYFFMLGSPFYNMFEDDVLSHAREIVALGHEAGLHFQAEPGDERRDLDVYAAERREVLSRLLGVRISAVSFHDPTHLEKVDLERTELGGMVNAYGAELMRRYTYCSDSNGYWRHRSLSDVLDEAPERLHVLTHPAWWTESPMPPRERIERLVTGRATAVMRAYDEALAKHGRRNIRSRSA